MQSSSKLTSNTLWFAVSCKTIGGAERRILNLAVQALQLNPNLSVNFLITPELYRNYCEDTQLKLILSNSEIKVYLSEWPNSSETQPRRSTLPLLRTLENGKKLHQRIVNRCFRLFPAWFLRKPQHKPKNFEHLKRNSWYKEMLQNTRPGDHVHCLVAHIERNGGVLLSQQGRTVVVELTSNRALEQSIPELKCILSTIGPCPNLKIQCISETVYQNFINDIGADFLEKYQVSCNYYRTACLPFEGVVSKEPPLRENIIVFGHRFVGPKNGVLFAEIIAEMYKRQELNHWKVHFRGFGPEEEAIRSILVQQIADQTVDIGWSSDLEGELQRSKIFVSIIATGSYPSQSVFQAMRNGNLLLLGDVGETAKRFAHEDVYLTPIDSDAIRNTLLTAMDDSVNSSTFDAKSRAMQEFFRTFSQESTQAKELLSLHFQHTFQTTVA